MGAVVYSDMRCRCRWRGSLVCWTVDMVMRACSLASPHWFSRSAKSGGLTRIVQRDLSRRLCSSLPRSSPLLQHYLYLGLPVPRPLPEPFPPSFTAAPRHPRQQQPGLRQRPSRASTYPQRQLLWRRCWRWLKCRCWCYCGCWRRMLWTLGVS